MNKIIIKGRLTGTPETRQTDSGKNVTSFSVAVNRQFNKDEADFFNCTAWEKTGEFVSKYFDKGQEILIEGRMESSHSDKNGEKRTYWKITVEQVDFCGSKNTNSNNNSNAPASANSDTSNSVAIGNLSDFEEIVGDDDFPF